MDVLEESRTMSRLRVSGNLAAWSVAAFAARMGSAAAMGAAIGALAGAALFAAPAVAQIRIGELNSYKAQPAFLEPYRKGWELALEEINSGGGVLGQRLEVIARDDNGNPGDAVRVAEDLVSRERAVLIFGTFLSNTGLAVADFANQRRVLFLAAEPLTDKITWQSGNRYTFRLRPSTYMQAAMLVPEAARLNRKRWAVIYPNYEYGQSAAATFKQLLRQAQPDVEFVAEQAPALGRIEAGAVVQALADAKPDAIFNATFGPDLARFVREGQTRGLFRDRVVVSLLSGEPEYLDPLRDEAPEGWLVTGYPWYGIQTPEHQRFLAAYQKRWNDYPRLGSVVGYASMMSIAEAIRKAGTTDTEKLIAAMRGLQLGSPFGPITYRAIDHQATMGAFVGTTALEKGRGVMRDFRYVDGAAVQPPDAEIRKMRPPAAMQ
jgi:branched-chain amino acid transport system substrate-binding protein